MAKDCREAVVLRVSKRLVQGGPFLWIAVQTHDLIIMGKDGFGLQRASFGPRVRAGSSKMVMV